MAASTAFESSLRRGNPTTLRAPPSRNSTPSSSDSTKRAATAPPRRSRSVSAFSRTSLSDFSGFSIKRDNPLFDNNNGNNDDDGDEAVYRNSILKSDQITSKTKHEAVATADDDNSNRRGRSISRNGPDGKCVSGSGKVNSKELSRSLSVVDTRRRGRSVSSTPVSRSHFATSESEAEQEGNLWMKSRSKGNLSATSSNGPKSNLVGSRSSLTRSSQRKPIDSVDASPKSLPCLKSAKWDDVASTSSFSEPELMESFLGDNMVENDTAAARDIYRTVRSEVRRAVFDIQNELESAIRRSNVATIATTDMTDSPPDLVNVGAAELISDIQQEYATKLEQSQERARQLRADLAVEEHRGMELSRILKEVLPDQKTPSTKKSRPGRKSSIERRKISKCLTEEALAYFDECVSLSTFDGSDFSSLEDPPLKLVGPGTIDGDNILLPHGSSSIPVTNFPCNYLDDKQDLCLCMGTQHIKETHESDKMFKIVCLDIYYITQKACSIDIGSAKIVKTSRHRIAKPLRAKECQFTYSHDPLDLVASNGSREQTRDQLSLKDTEWSRKFQFSFSPKPGKTCELQQDIRKYVKGFEKDIGKVDIDSQISRRNSYDPDEYNLQSKQQSLLFDHVFFKNRLESGSLLLCNGGCIAASFLPFASLT